MHEPTSDINISHVDGNEPLMNIIVVTKIGIISHPFINNYDIQAFIVLKTTLLRICTD